MCLAYVFTNDSLTWHPCRRRSPRHSETLSRGAFKIQQMMCGPHKVVALLCLEPAESEAVRMRNSSSPVADLLSVASCTSMYDEY